MNEIEIYRPVVGYEGFYEINMAGMVRSIDRIIEIKRGNQTFNIIRKGKSVKIQKAGRFNYLTIELSKDGKRKTWFLHRVLAMAFIPNPGDKKCVNHKNGNKTDNRIQNLEWVTHSENFQHAIQTGLIKNPFTAKNNKKGELHHCFGKTGELSQNSKIILDTLTGIFYFGAKEAAMAKDINLNCLRRKLWGGRPNDTAFRYV